MKSKVVMSFFLLIIFLLQMRNNRRVLYHASEMFEWVTTAEQIYKWGQRLKKNVQIPTFLFSPRIIREWRLISCPTPRKYVLASIEEKIKTTILANSQNKNMKGAWSQSSLRRIKSSQKISRQHSVQRPHNMALGSAKADK